MRWRARTIVQLRCALGASRPQLKRDPLGGGAIEGHSCADETSSRDRVPMTFLAVLAAIVLLAFFFPTSLFGPRLRLRCMCCGRTKDQVAAFISGPRVYICDQCVRDAAGAFITSGPPWALPCTATAGGAPATQRCSFCRKPAEDTLGLVLMAHGAICRACVELCLNILREDAQAAT